MREIYPCAFTEAIEVDDCGGSQPYRADGLVSVHQAEQVRGTNQIDFAVDGDQWDVVPSKGCEWRFNDLISVLHNATRQRM